MSQQPSDKHDEASAEVAAWYALRKCGLCWQAGPFSSCTHYLEFTKAVAKKPSAVPSQRTPNDDGIDGWWNAVQETGEAIAHEDGWVLMSRAMAERLRDGRRVTKRHLPLPGARHREHAHDGGLLKRILLPLAALALFLEECLWEAVTWVGALIARLPPVRWLERWLAGLHPYLCATLLVLLPLNLLPLKLSALWLVTHGHVLLGLQTLLAAKVAGTALVAWVWRVTKSQLLTVRWIARLYVTVLRWRVILYGWVRSTPAWRRLVELRGRVRAWLG